MSLMLLILAQAAVAVPPVTTPPKAKEKMYCSQEEVIGSRVKGKWLCRTKAENDQYLAQVKATLGERQRTGYFEKGGSIVCDVRNFQGGC